MADPARVRQIFSEALDLPEPERAMYLDRAAGHDPELRREVAALLAALARTPVLDATTLYDSSAPALSEGAGTRIGPYKLLQLIGEGGFGSVFMAEQEHPVRRHVALKIIKLGMDTRQVVARFEQERQALAMMDHPNIAKVFDAGATHTGRPYFVMELVKGVPITEYCDANHLVAGERCGLFVHVCHAIQHAHQKGIIHRDIKPSNVLVTMHDGTPVPKVIDFGVAKATDQRLTEKTIFTEFKAMIGTPAYMSPEQTEMSGLDIDTRSDVYSLGVLLYELLTGTTPFDPKSLHPGGLGEFQRIIREVEPPKPSTRLSSMTSVALEKRHGRSRRRRGRAFRGAPGSSVLDIARHRRSDPAALVRALRGDLDWIVMKCLEKQRTRRYETASGLAADMQRHLSGEAVVAAPPSAAYRLRKFIRRNKLPVMAAGAVTTALVVGLGIATWMFVKAQAGEKKAQIEAVKSQEVAQFLKDMLAGVGPSVALGRDTTMLQEIMDKTASRIGTDLQQQPEVEIELRLTLAWVYRDLQLFKEMEEMARETIRVSEAHFGAENLAVADALGQLGQALMYLRELDESETVTRESIAMQRKLRGADSLEEAFGLQNLGDILRYRGFRKDSIEDRLRIFEEAEAVDRACLRIRQRRLPGDSDELAVAYENLCQILDAQGRTGEAEEYIRASYEMARRLFGDEHPRTAKYCVGLGYLIGHSSDRLAEAESYIRRGLETQIRTQGREKFSLSYCHGQLGEILEKQGKLDDAELHYREAVAIGRRQLGANDPDLLNFLGSCAGLLKKRRKLDEARALAEEAVAFSRRLDRTHPLAQQGSFILLTEVLEAQGDGAALEALAAEALQDVRSRPVVDEPQLVVALTNLAKVMRQNGKPVEARPVAEEAVAICEHETSPVENWMRDDAFNELVEVLTAIGGDAALQALAVHRVQDLRSRPVVDQPRLAVALVDLAVVEHQAGELARARVLAEEAAAICEHNPGRIESWLQYRAFAELTDVLLDLGDKPALGDFADRLISRAESSGNTEQLAAGYAQAIPLLAGSDRSEQARDLVDRLVALDVPNGTADNRAAWFLATAEDPAWRDAALAVELSTRAVDSDPQVGSWWNTRGVAQYRAGDLQQAVSDLETSMQLGGGGNSFDFFFLAMIHEQLGDSVAALQWYEQGIAWMKRDSPTSHELQRFRAEAAELLGISELPSTARQTGGGARLEPVQE